MWECIKRHFLELGKDIQTGLFTVVGIGSDGDVFGNGMMQSPCIHLLAAFSVQHIFIDPDSGARLSHGMSGVDGRVGQPYNVFCQIVGFAIA